MNPNDPALMTRGSIDLIGRELKKFRGQGKGELPVPQRRRGAVGGGGTIKAYSRFAVVTDEAGASSHASTGISFGTVGKCILLDDSGAKSSEETDDKIEFKSAHRVKIPADTIIELS